MSQDQYKFQMAIFQQDKPAHYSIDKKPYIFLLTFPGSLVFNNLRLVKLGPANSKTCS